MTSAGPPDFAAFKKGTPPCLPPDLTRFRAASVPNQNDSTVFVTADNSKTSDNSKSDFEHLSEYLLWPHTHTRPSDYRILPHFPYTSRPRLSVATDAKFERSVSGSGEFTARALICFCARQQAISVTLRSSKHTGGEAWELDRSDRVGAWPPLLPTGVTASEVLKCNYTASTKREVGDDRFWFSIATQCEVLHRLISPNGQTPRGLVVLTGSTNASKSQIARGLIHLVLEAAKRKNRRPHLVTFEDPIEEFYVAGRRPSVVPAPEQLAEDVTAEKTAQYHTDQEAHRKYLDAVCQVAPFESVGSSPLLAQAWGVDYTPRERGLDAHDLDQVFADALRQTPTVLYVGEVRDPSDWPKILEFAGTGHLVVTTAHAGSLLEAMTKILSAAGAKTPADRRLCAEKLRAVVHLRSIPDVGPTTSDARTLLLPSVWRTTPAGLAALSVSGLGAITPTFLAKDDGTVSSLGRGTLLELLSEEIGAKVDLDLGMRSLRAMATQFDLLGE